MDSGIRSGQDLLKEIAHGAKGKMIGRAFKLGVGAMGEPGVTNTLEIIHAEFDTSMALCGLQNPGEITRNAILSPHGCSSFAEVLP